MDLERSITFPLSHVEETSRKSPFSVHEDDVGRLGSCEAFQIIRSLLIRQKDSTFCSFHRTASKEDEEAWLLQRDITHALVLPVIEIYRYASQLARSVLGNRNIFDLELVFRGEARGAFSWLQCFIVEEENWCSTRGCPACVVNYVLQAEPTIRMVLLACRLSQSLRRSPGEPSPVLDFWLSSLRRALDEDPFWGPGFWKDVEARASTLENGIQQLVRQCHDLESRTPRNKNRAGLGRATTYSFREVSKTSTELQSSKLANRHTSLANEGNSLAHRIVLACWTTILADAAEASRNLSILHRPIQLSRPRSYTL
ncbi:hypothetical protein MMC22_001067 [Lobaria immixta]|nr:hypothetical protein [Lobaria immixta]